MLRIFLAVLCGYVLIGVLVAATDQAFNFAIPGFAVMTVPPPYYFAISLMTDFLYTAVGGYVCAWIAKGQARPAALGLVILGEVIGIVTQIVFWDKVPHWFGLGLVLIYPFAVYLGMRLRAARSLA